ncbi:RraA family protein [Polycladidibacter hongkongensis]|uniref:RraA family protein n=1 Tax=Polycladidibacter hongkongensis TaxID=1647556 RepID=UPI0008313264|nr:acyl transferase [Pseudovibrio hongkongensis]
MITPSLLELLKKVDTPTVCNAIEVAQGKRGFNDFTRGTMLCSAPEEGAIVGFALTAKISAIAPPEEAPEIIKKRRMDYYRHMASCPELPTVAVIEDMDGAAAIGAFWGEINANIHRGFGICGVLTNGVMRDLGDLPKGFPVIAGSIGPSHGFVHVRDIDCPVNVFGLNVAPKSLVHADRHGAVVIPSDLYEVLEDAINKLLSTERIILDAARAPGFDFDSFQKAWSAFEAART